MQPAIGDGTLIHPAGKDSTHRAPKLCHGILRKGLAGFFFYKLQILTNQRLQRLSIQIGIFCHIQTQFQICQQILK